MKTVGFITKDSKGDVGVVTSFSFINKALYINGEGSILVTDKTGGSFKIKAIKGISSINNLVFLEVKGDLTAGGKRPPLTITDSHEPDEQLFYALRKLSTPSLSWFQTKSVQKTVSLPRRLDFLVRDSYAHIKADHAATFVGIPIFNQKGEIVSFVSDGVDHVLYGIPLRDMKDFLQSPENCSFSFIRGCVIKARHTLFKQIFASERRSHQASYMLMLYTAKPVGIFKQFMRSFGKSYWAGAAGYARFFWKEAAQWDPKLYYYWLVNHKELSESKRKEHFEFLEQNSSVKQLAQEGHPHFQYLMGFIYLYLDNSSQAEYWFKESAGNGYIPGLWESVKIHLNDGLSIVSSFAEKGYIPAYRLLGLLHQDFRKAKGFLKKHNEKGHDLDILKLGPQDVLGPFQEEIEIQAVTTAALRGTDGNERGRRFSEGLAHLETSLDFCKNLQNKIMTRLQSCRTT